MDLQKRIEKLEKERWLYLGLAVLGSLAGLVGAGVATMKYASGNLSAKSLVVNDSKGIRRAQLFVDDKGLAALAFYDAAKGVMPLQVVGVSPKGEASVRMNNINGQPQLLVMLTEEGMPLIGVNDANGKNRAKLTMESSDPVFALSDPNEKRVVSIQGAGVGGGKVTLTDPIAGKMNLMAADPAVRAPPPAATKAGT